MKKILAKHKATGRVLTFDSEVIFKHVAKDYDRIENYQPVIQTKTPEPQIIESKELNTSVISVEEFNELLDVWTNDELHLFANDTRLTIQRQAAKEIRKRSKKL